MYDIVSFEVIYWLVETWILEGTVVHSYKS